MSQPPRVLTLLRGAQLRDARDEREPRGEVARGEGARQPQPAAGSETIYGIPASAVQHCCGRGCKHCRVYWHGKRQ